MVQPYNWQLGSKVRADFGMEKLLHQASSIELAPLSADEMRDLVRSLFGDQVIRYSEGIWTLPVTRPDSVLPAALGAALATRLAPVSAPARSLAECLSLGRSRALVPGNGHAGTGREV
jgi:hypothetical protein